VHHHQLLPSESFVADSVVVLASVWHVNVPALRLQHAWTRKRTGLDVVSSAEGLLLYDSRPGLLNDRSARASANSSSNAFPYAAAHTTAHTTANPTSHAWRSC